jgi:hypothetical protein
MRGDIKVLEIVPCCVSVEDGIVGCCLPVHVLTFGHALMNTAVD